MGTYLAQVLKLDWSAEKSGTERKRNREKCTWFSIPDWRGGMRQARPVSSPLAYVPVSPLSAFVPPLARCSPLMGHRTKLHLKIHTEKHSETKRKANVHRSCIFTFQGCWKYSASGVPYLTKHCPAKKKKRFSELVVLLFLSCESKKRQLRVS